MKKWNRKLGTSKSEQGISTKKQSKLISHGYGDYRLKNTSSDGWIESAIIMTALMNKKKFN